MKKGLLSATLLSLLALTALAGCNGGSGEEVSSSEVDPYADYEEVEIADILDWDNIAQEPTFIGDKVAIKEVTVSLANNDFLIINDTTGNTVLDLVALEVVAAEDSDVVIADFGWKDSVDVYGTISQEDGRITIEADYIEKLSKAEGVYYNPYFDREFLSSYGSRLYSGALVEGTFQLITAPHAVAGETTYFEVIFPGEDPTSLEDNPENPFILECVVPNMSEANAEEFNTNFADYEVGDYLVIFGAFWFDNGYASMVVDQISARNLEPATITNVYDTYEELLTATKPNEAFANFYKLPDLTPSSENIVVFSYVSDGAVDGTTSSAKAVKFMDIIAYTYFADELYEDFVGKLVANKNWTLEEEVTGACVYDLNDTDDYVIVFNYGAYVQVEFASPIV